jgi:hypothetical protein
LDEREEIVIDNHENFGGFSSKPFNFQFNLRLLNYGQAMARWVKILIVVEDDDPLHKNFLLKGTDATDRYWKPPHTVIGPQYTWSFVFQGGDNFVSYSFDRKSILNVIEVTDDIGEFIMVIPVDDNNNDKKRQRLRFCIESIDFPRKEQTFIFCTKPRKRSELKVP